MRQPHTHTGKVAMDMSFDPDGQRVLSRMFKNGNLLCRKFYWGEYEEIYYYSNSETVRTYWVEAPEPCWSIMDTHL